MKYLLILLLAGTILSAQAEESHQILRGKLVQAIPELEIDSIEMSPVSGLYSVSLQDGSVLQASEDGSYFIYGDLYEIQGNDLVNWTEIHRTVRRRNLMDSLDESNMIVFSPPGDEVKASITVFTDVDCTYCRMFHQEVSEMNKMGIAVRYLAFPRSGIDEPHSSGYKKMVSAWCADNPKLALTNAKANQQIADKTCINPIDFQFTLGKQMGINATPTILFDDGRISTGYMTAAQLSNSLELDYLNEIPQ